MTLEQFVQLNLDAAVLLYRTGRMRLLTDDERFLTGEATGLEAMALLLQRQLSVKNDARLCNDARNQREVREGVRPARVRAGRFKGVTFDGRYHRAKGTKDGKAHWLGYFKTDVEAARAYDAWVTANNPRCKTNAQLGLLGEEA